MFLRHCSSRKYQWLEEDVPEMPLKLPETPLNLLGGIDVNIMIKVNRRGNHVGRNQALSEASRLAYVNRYFYATVKYLSSKRSASLGCKRQQHMACIAI